MTNQQIVTTLRTLVAQVEAMLANPMFDGTLPTLCTTSKPDEDGGRLCLTVGVEWVTDGDDDA
jgi:hypothetical protein